MKNFGKYLLLILTFFSIGEASANDYASSEIKQELPFSSEDIKAVNVSFFASRVNPLQELIDLSKNHYFATESVFQSDSTQVADNSIVAQFYYKRDLRRFISNYIFPQHFFL